MDQPLADLRKEYTQAELLEDQVASDPISQFQRWFEAALATEKPEPHAMILVTVGLDLKPSSRVVLLKSFDQQGFVFFSNYHSRKGRQIAENPQVALSFYWGLLERQVRIEGLAERIAEAESDAYFASRPEGSKLGAHASEQSQVIPSREFLAARQAELAEQFAGQVIPRPAHWGGYRVKPERVEFWQGRPSRLHDRLVYSRQAEGWGLQRLAP